MYKKKGYSQDSISPLMSFTHFISNSNTHFLTAKFTFLN